MSTYRGFQLDEVQNVVGAQSLHWCQLNVSLAVETAATQTKPAYAGSKLLIFRQSAQADFVFVAATSSRQGLS